MTAYSKYTMVILIVLTILDDIVVDKRTFKDVNICCQDLRNSHCPLLIGSFVKDRLTSYFDGYMDDVSTVWALRISLIT